jgi:hypothetical protein
MPGLRTVETRGDSRTHFDQTITPIARVTQLTWPGGRIAWHRPVAVEAARGDRVRRIPIHNATRRLVVGIVLAEAALGALAWWGQQRSLQHPHKRSTT